MAQKPAATIPPAAPEAKLTEREDDAKLVAKKGAAPAGTKTQPRDLRSLGYVQGGADKAGSLKDENAAKQDAAPVPEAVPGSAPSEDSLAARSDEPAPPARSKEKRSSSRALEAQLARESAEEPGVSGAAATGPRSLLYEAPDISVTFSEEGMVTLVLRGYACSVSVASPATKESEFSPAPELAPLFTQASSHEILSAVASSTKPAGPSQETEAPRLKTLSLRNPRGGNIYAVNFGDTPETAPPRPVLDLEEAMRRAVASRFRKTLEDRCGPIRDDSALLGP
jgi:hypothetical protein